MEKIDIVDFIPCILIYVDKENKIVEVNSRIKEFGYNFEDLINKNIFEIPLFNDKKNLLEIFENKGEIFKTIILTKNGEKKSVICEVDEIKGKGNVIILHDISEEEILRLKIEKEEKILKEWFLLHENSIAGVYIYDENFNFLYVNPSFCKLLGYKRNEILGKKKAYELVEDDEVERVKELARKRFKGELNGANLILKFKTKTGKIKYLSAFGRRTNFKGKNVIAGTLLDITDRIEIEEELKQKQRDIESTLNGTIHALSKIVEVRDPYTAGHQLRVSLLVEAICKEIGYSEELIKEIVWASLLHDIGKICVPSEILVVPRKLTPIEYSLVKTHPIVGYNILRTIPYFKKIAEIVLQHHERNDGTGYPRGIKGEEILKEAKILAVSDVFEAMVSHRPYRPALSIEDALKDLVENKEKKYDPEIVDVCVEIITKKGFDFVTNQ